MDLLDSLKDSGRATTFSVQYDTQVIPDVEDTQPVHLVHDHQSTQASTQLTNIADKVKEKLAQVSEEPNWDDFNFNSSSLFGNSTTQNVEASAPTQSVGDQTTQQHYLPQLGVEDVEIDEQETQPIEAQILENNGKLSADENENTIDEVSLPTSKEDRLLKISKLAELKRQQRLAKEQQEEELVADITHTSLTDEEEDELAHDRSVISTAKDPIDVKLREAEEFLHAQKRSRNIQPEFKKKITFTTENLLNEFENLSESESILGLEDTLQSPITSPLKNKQTKPESDHCNDYDDIHSDPIKEYAKNLKHQLLSSPSKNEIDLDFDLDNDSEVPELGKDEVLRIKQKFVLKKMKDNPKLTLINLPKNIRSSINNQPRIHDSKDLINSLQQANISQLQRERKNNPLHEELEEIEKDEEVMGSLLEREMERARIIRKREKLFEKAKEALLKGENNDSGEVDYKDDEEEEVPDSDFGSEQDGSEVSEGSDEDEDEDDIVRIHKPKITLSDEEVDVREIDNRKDDSYMFGAKAVDNEEETAINNGYVTTGNTPEMENEKHSDAVPENSFLEDSYKLFLNLQSRKSSNNENDKPSYDQTNDDFSHLKLPSFHDITQGDATQGDATQADTTIATQADVRKTHTVADTQILASVREVLENSDEKNDEDDDDEDINPINVRRARKHLRQKMSDVMEENDGDKEVEEDTAKELESSGQMTEQESKKQLAEFERKIRRKELKLIKKRKEMERKGLKKIIEGEAEESEDEWHGLGGIDGELSDVANSEDEKMIDNDFNIDLNDEEVKRKFMEQYQIKDKKELEKLLDDIKNHRLTKRAGANNGFDIELSDEEDELLSAYRKQRLAEQRQRLLENKKMQDLAKNAKSKAFFSSIQDATLLVSIDEEGDSDKENVEEEQENSDKELEAELDTKKRTIRVEESFVQKQLSFLNNVGENEEIEYIRQQKLSNIQYGYASDNEEFDDLQTMKKKCMENLVQGSGSASKRPHDLTDADSEEDSELFPSFKRPSLTRSFKSNDSSVEVSSFSGVTIRKQYKAANGSKASISGMSKKVSLKAQGSTSLKEKRIIKSISRANRSSNGSFFQGEGFEN